MLGWIGASRHAKLLAWWLWPRPGPFAGADPAGPHPRCGCASCTRADMTGELVFLHAGFGASAVPYHEGWELQRRLHERRVAGQIPDTCLLLEHEPVYTAGKRTGPADRPLGDPGAPVVDVD